MQPCHIELPGGVNFEAPREYAAFCGGCPVRVTSLDRTEDDVLIRANIDTLSFAHGNTLVEYELSALVGLVVNMKEEIAGTTACTLRTVLTEKNGETILLPIFSANPSNAAGFEGLITSLRSCKLPISIYSSVRDLPVRRR
jgi:hypothetical protein